MTWSSFAFEISILKGVYIFHGVASIEWGLFDGQQGESDWTVFKYKRRFPRPLLPSSVPADWESNYWR